MATTPSSAALPTLDKVIRTLPPFPPVAGKLVACLSKPDILLRDVAAILRLDGVLSGQALRLANSPLIGLRREVHSIQDAVALLGMERVSNLVMTTVLHGLFRRNSSSKYLPLLWRHHLATAILSEQFAPIFEVGPERVYPGGLLHDLGRVGLLTTFPDRYGAMLSEAADLQAEKAAFGVTHAALGEQITERWGLPVDIRDAVGQHHEILQDWHRPTVHCVRAACEVASAIGFGLTGTPDEQKFRQGWARLGPSAGAPPLPAVQAEVTALLQAVENAL